MVSITNPTPYGWEDRPCGWQEEPDAPHANGQISRIQSIRAIRAFTRLLFVIFRVIFQFQWEKFYFVNPRDIWARKVI